MADVFCTDDLHLCARRPSGRLGRHRRDPQGAAEVPRRPTPDGRATPASAARRALLSAPSRSLVRANTSVIGRWADFKCAGIGK